MDLESVLPESDSEHELLDIIYQHIEATDSAKAKYIISDWNNARPKFVKVFPVDYRNALTIKSQENKGG
ncbi:MAG: hypothetical protein GX625_09845 [Clostridiaceae bacterium]|nr:hypothetical protein [Clostridiaceae bacterium]